MAAILSLTTKEQDFLCSMLISPGNKTYCEQGELLMSKVGVNLLQRDAET